MNILILGSTGHLGKVLLKTCLENNYNITILIRSASKIDIKNKNLKIIEGDVTNKLDLEKSLKNIDVVISTLGHGFRTNFPIQEKTMISLIPLMREKKINRLITITGAGLKIKGDPNSFIANISEKLFYIIDPYRMSDAKKQQSIIENSDLNWTTIRTPVHNNKNSMEIKKIGYTQPKPWETVSRKAICEFIIECINKNEWSKKSPIIY